MPPNPTHTPRPIVILGPTAGGKSELAVRLAEALPTLRGRGRGRGGQVIGADSMQVYRHLDAGTAKPPRKLRERVPHHLIDIVEPSERFTVTDWLALADAKIAQIRGQAQVPIVVGGTNLYMKALLEGMFEAPPADPAFRAGLEKEPDTVLLHRRLGEVDPHAAQRIDPNDRRRIIRALEVHHHTGKPISELQTQWTGAGAYRHDPILLGLRWPTEAINHRINLRVKAMFFPDKVPPQVAADVCINGESLPDEVARLVKHHLLGTEATPQANEAIGYKQCLAALRGLMSWDDAFEKTKIATRRLGKAQRTWLKRFQGVHWIDCDAETTMDEVMSRAMEAVGG